MKKITLKFSCLIAVCFITAATTAQSPALLFNGSDNYIQYNEANTLFEANNNFTLEMWVKSGNSAPGCIYAEGSAGSNTDQFRIWGSGGKLVVRPINSSSPQIVCTDVNGNNLFGSEKPWYHIAIVGTPGASAGDIDLVVYINGENRGSTTYTKPSTDYDNSLIGKYSGSGGAFDGEIDELRAWSVSRSQSQIANNTCNPETTTGLVRHIRFNENTGATVTDEIGGPIGNIEGTAPTWTTNSNCSPVLSTTSNALKTGVLIYPNPVKDILSIKTINSKVQITSLSIFNVTGKLILKSNTSKHINTSSFSPGIYILKIESKEGDVLNKKLVIK